MTADTKVDVLAEHLREADGLTLVFVRTKRGADRLVQKLAATAWRPRPCTAISRSARQRALERFESECVRCS